MNVRPLHAWLRLTTLTALLLTAACAPQEAPETLGGADKADEVSVEACTDIAPGDEFTCGEQVGWGKCDEPFMQGFCNRSCGRCEGIGNVVDTCEDIAPGDRFTCDEQASWGKCDEPWMEGFCQVSCGTCPINEQLIDPQASESAKELMSYLVETHGKAIVSGQQKREDADHMAALTGRFPALVGFDLMDYSPSRIAHGSSSTETDKALEWWRDKGGIVTVSWHWNAPSDLIDSEEYPWWKGFYTKGTTFDLPKGIRDRHSRERELLIRDIDAAAVQLQRLEDAGVPVLWRPIHEAAGTWFWWGAHGPDVHKALWRLMYDRLANHHGIHNLIWVWNGQDASWYPGDQYVDIIAEDIYDGERNHEPQQAKYLQASRYTQTRKLVALSETGALLDPSDLEASSAKWSYFMLWSGHFAQEQEWNTDALKREVYASDYVITLDELPVFGSTF